MRAVTRRRLIGRKVAAAAALTILLAPYFNPATVTAAQTFAAEGTVELAFTPGDAIDAKIVAAVDRAEHEVQVLAYSFTSPKIARSLAQAHGRGIKVEVVADRAQTLELPQSRVPGLARDGVPVWLDGSVGAAHNKVIVVDADSPHATTITGSYNFTLAAQMKNAENVAIFRDNSAIARTYRAYFQRRQKQAQRWHGEAAPRRKRHRAR